MYNKGFTLIELIAVILLIAILAVSVAPKMSGTAGYEAHTHRAQLLAALRLTQQRAMQQTDSADGYCHQIVFDRDYPRYGVPDRKDCDNITFSAPLSNNTWDSDATGHLVDGRYEIIFNVDGQTNPKAVAFDWMGRPTKDCAGGCEINVIQAEGESLKITIEEEGYIHVFDFP